MPSSAHGRPPAAGLRIRLPQRQITLCEIVPGEVCILNAACVLARRGYPAEAATLEPTKCLLVPAEKFRRLFAESETLRD